MCSTLKAVSTPTPTPVATGFGETTPAQTASDRVNAFTTVVGNLQPILAQVPTFIERAVMSADPEEEDVLLSAFDQVLDTPPLRPALDEMVAMDVEADLEEICQAIPSAPLTLKEVEQLLTTSVLLKSSGAVFEPASKHTWQLTFRGKNYAVTFYPEVFDETPSLRLMSFGDPLFEELVQVALTSIKFPSPLSC